MGTKTGRVAKRSPPAGAGRAVPAKAGKAQLRPSQCRAYMRKTLATEFRGIVEGFIKGAKSGSCQHVKLATELLEPRARKAKAASGRSTLERWVEELEKGL